MALIAITNTKSYQFKIDTDASDRDNTYSKFNFAASETKYIDESDINPYGGENVETKGLPNALASGALTVTATDIDSLTILPVKNYLAGGLGQKYYYAGEGLTAKYIVILDTATGKAVYDSALGATANLGVVRLAGILNDYVRIQVSGTATVTAGETLAEGDLVAGFTDGTAKKVTDKGDYYLGEVTTGNTVGNDVIITINPGVIA